MKKKMKAIWEKNPVYSLGITILFLKLICSSSCKPDNKSDSAGHIRKKGTCMSLLKCSHPLVLLNIEIAKKINIF